MPKLAWLNGELWSQENATVNVADHAHLYGDGIFEGIRIYGRKVFKLDEHLDRLFHGIAYMAYEMSMTKAELRETILDVARQADMDDAYIRLNVTRGTGLGLDPKNIDRTPNVMVLVSSLSLYPPEAYELGLNVVTSSYRVFAADSLDPRVKCIGRYASNILAKLEANQRGAGEAVMLNHQGQLAECCGDNIFMVSKGRLLTPHNSCGILSGITRATVLDLAREAGMEVEEGFYTLYDLFGADEAFLTGTAAEIIAMASLDGRKLGCGGPGPTTQDLAMRFRKLAVGGVPF